MLADGVVAVYVISRVHQNLNGKERIASGQCVAEDCIREIGHAVPCHTIRLAASHYAKRIYRNLHSQVKRMILGDEVFGITHRIGEETGCVIVLIVVRPYKRRIQYADGCYITMLCYYA